MAKTKEVFKSVKALNDADNIYKKRKEYNDTYSLIIYVFFVVFVLLISLIVYSSN